MTFSSPLGTRVPHLMRGRAPSGRMSNRPRNSPERRASCPLSRFSKRHSTGAGPYVRTKTQPPRRNLSSERILSKSPQMHPIYHFQPWKARKKSGRGGST